MAIGLRRKQRLDSRRIAQKITRCRNGRIKQKERARRDARVMARIKASPDRNYGPEVQSWISRQIGRPFSVITPEEVDGLIG